MTVINSTTRVLHQSELEKKKQLLRKGTGEKRGIMKRIVFGMKRMMVLKRFCEILHGIFCLDIEKTSLVKPLKHTIKP